MARQFVIVLLAVILPPLLGTVPQAVAQTSPIAEPGAGILPPPRVRRRIEIAPRPLLYRRCVDWYELQYRPSGTVLYPQMHCWWVRG
jgi:hypothetical protein